MTGSHAIVVGASSGGVAALLELVAQLPRSLNAVVGVVLHVGSRQSILPELLSSRSSWRAVQQADGEPLAPGVIYVAPPDHHMLFTADAVRLSRGPRENYARPAVDPLFRSAALEWRERTIGIVLTGDLDDGTAGLAAVKACGGIAIVQDPATAFEPSMPASALANVQVDHCLPLAEIPPALARLAFTARSLDNEQAYVAEHALWADVRALQEREMLLRRLASVAEATGDTAQAEIGRRQADRVKAQAEQLSRLVESEMNSA
jgi:two-component system chemotaxis response regulator CheB